MSLVYKEASPFVQHYMFAREHLGCTPFEAGLIANLYRDQPPLTESEAEYVKSHWNDGDDDA